MSADDWRDDWRSPYVARPRRHAPDELTQRIREARGQRRLNRGRRPQVEIDKAQLSQHQADLQAMCARRGLRLDLETGTVSPIDEVPA